MRMSGVQRGGSASSATRHPARAIKMPFARNAALVALLAALSAAIRGAEALAMVDGLVGSRWVFTLDFGREKNTWMPPSWARSGLRFEVPLAVQLEGGGRLHIVEEGAFANMGAIDGRWEVKGRFPDERFQGVIHLEKGYARGDNELPPGKLYLSMPAFKSQLSSKEGGGNLTVLQKRWLVREERRLVGTFTATAVDGGAFPILPTAKTYEDDRNVL